jgi:hypothetical protein
LKSKEAIDEILVWFPSAWRLGASVRNPINEPDGECALQRKTSWRVVRVDAGREFRLERAVQEVNALKAPAGLPH